MDPAAHGHGSWTMDPLASPGHSEFLSAMPQSIGISAFFEFDPHGLEARNLAAGHGDSAMGILDVPTNSCGSLHLYDQRTT